MAIGRSRTIAFQVLLRVETEQAFASDLLHSALGPGVSPADAALATELTLGVLRWRRLLDFLLQKQLKKPVERLDLAVVLALRLGLYQIRFLQRVPHHAIVHDSVELVKVARKSSAASMVNAVLRRSLETAHQTAESLLPPDISPGERLGISRSHPTWLVERWLELFGEERTISLLEANNRPPRLCGSLRDPSEFYPLAVELEGAGLRLAPGLLVKNAFSIGGGSPARTKAFAEGRISIQDEASQLVSLLLSAQRGDRVLDLCAAPGGKTPSLARAAGDVGFIVASDLHTHRLRAMRAQFGRIGLTNVRLLQLDAAAALPFALPFQKILVDAPCTGTGTLARHPEIRWKLKPVQIDQLHRLQSKILYSALEILASGGQLVYSTCSLEPEENEEVIAEVLSRMPSIRRVSPEVSAKTLAPHLAPGVSPLKFFGVDGYFRTLPGQEPSDGFFAAVLEKQ